jgi:hypothetical protein
MEHDIYDSLRLAATICEKFADVLNAIAEYCEKVTACFMDLPSLRECDNRSGGKIR